MADGPIIIIWYMGKDLALKSSMELDNFKEYQLPEELIV